MAALAGLAELSEWRGDYAGGLKLLAEAGELTAPDLIVSRARLLQRSGHAAKAADLLRREEAAGVGWRPWHHAQAGFSLAQILDELGDYPEAFEAATRANQIRGGRFDSGAHTRWVNRKRHDDRRRGRRNRPQTGVYNRYATIRDQPARADSVRAQCAIRGRRITFNWRYRLAHDSLAQRRQRCRGVGRSGQNIPGIAAGRSRGRIVR